jgi:hypothetical protein
MSAANRSAADETPLPQRTAATQNHAQRGGKLGNMSDKFGARLIVRHSRKLLPIIVLSCVVGMIHLGRAAEERLNIGDFTGHFRGEAQSQSDDRFFIRQLRDLDVDVRGDGAGFTITWTTMIHPGQAADAQVRQRITTLRFVPSAEAGTFHTAEPFEPFTGLPAAWAQIEGEALIVHVLSVYENGNYELQTYSRTLSGDVMTLHFTRDAPGYPEFVVTGRLTRDQK